MTAWNGRAAPSLDALAAMAEAAYRRLPQPFRQMAGDIVFHVQDFADEETLKSMGIEDPFELTGLYEGVDLTDRTAGDLPGGQSRVHLYRRPILDEWAERGDVALDELVEHVLVHEIGHHLGLSDEEIEAIEASGG
jgi:predicted Zn-dependent protease with MMP-like domain